MAKLFITRGGRSTYVSLNRNINAVGERYTVPDRRMRAALHRIGARQLSDVTTNGYVFHYHGGYAVSFEYSDKRTNESTGIRVP